MDYEAVLDYLYEKLPYYQRKGPAAYKGSLDNTLALDHLFDHPHRQFRSIHIAGTNGKGSVSHMLAAVLQKAGYKTALYTSPHLKDFRERIRVNGQMIPKAFVNDFVQRFLEMNRVAALEPSFFELTVLMAFDYFSKEKVDVAVVETGLGGRLDSTNIITPELSVITNISMDHTALLGDSLGKIALEKAGIIKPFVPVVIGESHPQTAMIFEGIAAERHAPIQFADQLLKCDYAMVSADQKQLFNIKSAQGMVYENLKVDLLGKYQSKNVCTLLCAVDQLNKKKWAIQENELRAGVEEAAKSTGLMGRWQLLGANPKIVADTAHNEAGIREVVAQLRQTPFRQLHMVIGMVNDKDIGAVLALLPREANYYFTNASLPRALPALQLMQMAAYFDLKGSAFPTVAEAVKQAKFNAGIEDLIFIGGSTFVVAEALP